MEIQGKKSSSSKILDSKNKYSLCNIDVPGNWLHFWTFRLKIQNTMICPIFSKWLDEIQRNNNREWYELILNPLLSIMVCKVRILWSKTDYGRLPERGTKLNPAQPYHTWYLPWSESEDASRAIHTPDIISQLCRMVSWRQSLYSCRH